MCLLAFSLSRSYRHVAATDSKRGARTKVSINARIGIDLDQEMQGREAMEAWQRGEFPDITANTTSGLDEPPPGFE